MVGEYEEVICCVRNTGYVQFSDPLAPDLLRAMDCVSACAGISTEDLRKVIDGKATLAVGCGSAEKYKSIVKRLAEIALLASSPNFHFGVMTLAGEASRLLLED